MASTTQLEEWWDKNLPQRCLLIKKMWDIPISPSGLSDIYRRLKVKFKRSKYEIETKYTEAEKKQQRYDYIDLYIKYRQEEREVFYLDETSTNLWMWPRMVWWPSN